MTQLNPLERLGARLPIFQAPIGSVASPELAASVSEAGGIGNLALTWRTPEQASALLEKARNLTSKPLGANFVLGFPFDDVLDAALDAGVPLVSFFWASRVRT